MSREGSCLFCPRLAARACGAASRWRGSFGFDLTWARTWTMHRFEGPTLLAQLAIGRRLTRRGKILIFRPATSVDARRLGAQTSPFAGPLWGREGLRSRAATPTSRPPCPRLNPLPLPLPPARRVPASAKPGRVDERCRAKHPISDGGVASWRRVKLHARTLPPSSAPLNPAARTSRRCPEGRVRRPGWAVG